MISEGIYNILIVSSKLLNQKLKENLLPIGPMINEAKALLNSDYLNSINRLDDICPKFELKNSFFWESNWNKEILFWLKPPFHAANQGQYIKLNGNQIKVGTPLIGHHRVRGVAGSGKTQALAYRAASLMSQGNNVLILSFNITLWHYIKDMVNKCQFNFSWGQIRFGHYHGFCKDMLNEFGIDWPKPKHIDLEIFFRLIVTNSVITGCKLSDGYEKYDAILIDEGQDYCLEWYDLLNNYFMTNRDELLVVCDKKQNIYERDLEWLDKRKNAAGLSKFKDSFIDLTTIYRFPKEISDLANLFSETFGLNQELKSTGFGSNQTSLSFSKIIWFNLPVDRYIDVENYLYLAYLRLKKQNQHPSDMVFLLPNHELGLKVVDYFNQKHILVNHVFHTDGDKRNKKTFWMGDSRLKMCTYHSFKGWEIQNVVAYIPEFFSNEEVNFDSVLYIALTRARNNLIVLNRSSRYLAFGDLFPNHWDNQ
jgi:superfamily I DNA/RNA helicase